MGNDNLRDLLNQGFDSHASALGSGDDYASRHLDRVTGKVRRRRAVRQVGVTGGALVSVAALAFGAHAVADASPRPGASPSGSGLPSPDQSVSPNPFPSPSPLPTDGREKWVTGTYVPPLPAGEAQGSINEDAMLRFIAEAPPPAAPGAPSPSVACGTPVGGTYIDPIFDGAVARILKPDTNYPTFLDPSYLLDKSYGEVDGDVLLNLGWWLKPDGSIDTTAVGPGGTFFVGLSFLSHATREAWTYHPDTDSWSGGLEVSYNLVAREGVLNDTDFMAEWTDNIDLALGTVLVRDGVIVGHADLWSAADPYNTKGTGLSTINEVLGNDGSVDTVRDFGVGPLEAILWCPGASHTGEADAYAVMGTRPFEQPTFSYSFIWAGRVDYK